MQPALIAAAALGALGFVATLALIRAIRRELAESYDVGRIAGFVAGARHDARAYQRAVSRDRAQ